MTDYDPYSMPRGVKLALVVTWIQTVLNALGGLFIVIGAVNDLEHGRDDAAPLVAVGILGVAIAITLGVSSFFAAGGFAWSRVVILVFESFAVFGTLVSFVTTLNPFALLGFGLAVLVIGQFASRPAREWFVS